jgi:hypothetical protein
VTGSLGKIFFGQQYFLVENSFRTTIFVGQKYFSGQNYFSDTNICWTAVARDTFGLTPSQASKEIWKVE